MMRKTIILAAMAAAASLAYGQHPATPKQHGPNKAPIHQPGRGHTPGHNVKGPHGTWR